MNGKKANPSNTNKASILYALSIHMKYGEVLHVEGLAKEEKDQYFDLARKEGQSMLVEDKSSVRHLMSNDIAKVSARAYDEKYEKIYHPVEKMLFSESSLGRRIFSMVIRGFVLLSFMGVIAMFGLVAIEGNIMDVLFDAGKLSETFVKGFDLMNVIFGYTVILMVLLNVVDLALGLRAHYYINQDGAEPVETSRLSNVVVTAAFVIIFLVIKIGLETITRLL